MRTRHLHECIGALKGGVRIESERDTGTTFLIELPFAPPL
jgi:chemotaxis protein histidine kinase CheA